MDYKVTKVASADNPEQRSYKKTSYDPDAVEEKRKKKLKEIGLSPDKTDAAAKSMRSAFSG